MRNLNLTYSVVIPVYKSSKSITTIAEEFSILQVKKGYKIEIIFVNDSPFHLETKQALRKVEGFYRNVSVVTLRKNQGQHMALLIGISRAKGDYIITMDDDLQHPVEEVPKLIEAIHKDDEAEAVFAVPGYKQKKHDLWRNFGSYVLNKVDIIFLNKPKGLIKSSFRIMTADLAKVVVNNYNAMPAISSIIISSTDSIKNIYVEHRNREYGSSNYSLSKLITLSLNNILHYSALPLKAVGFIGFIGLFFSFIFIFIVVTRKLFIGIEFPGYASTVSLVSFFGGLNLFAVGLIGEYLIRILREQQKRNLRDFIKEENETNFNEFNERFEL